MTADTDLDVPLGARVLALRALGLGDLLTAVPALRALADFYPSCRLVLATTPAMAPLAEQFPFVNEVVKVAPLAPLPSEVGAVDVAVNLHGRGPQSTLLLQACQPSRLIAFANEAARTDGPLWRPDEHEVARWCRLLMESGIPADASLLSLDPPAAEAPYQTLGATVVHPGAAFPSRRWPVDRWAEIVRFELQEGRAVVITGGNDEIELCEEVARMAGLDRSCVLAGRTDLLELAAGIAAARRVVCGDTGVAHLATAFSIPSVVLFGPVPPSEWGPPNLRIHRCIWKGERGDPHGTTLDPGLERITVSDVIAALGTLPDLPRVRTGDRLGIRVVGPEKETVRTGYWRNFSCPSEAR